MTSNQETHVQQESFSDEDDIHFDVVAWQQLTQENPPIINLCQEDGEVASEDEQSDIPVDEFDLTEALQYLDDDIQYLDDDILAIELACASQETSHSPEKVDDLPARDVSPPPKQEATKEKEYVVDSVIRGDFFNFRRAEQQKVFDSFEKELQTYASIQKASSNQKKKNGFTSSHTITKRDAERERSRSNDRSTTGSSYRRELQEDKVAGTKDLSRKIIWASAQQQQNRIVELSSGRQQHQAVEKNIESKQNSSKSRKRKRTSIETTGSDRIETDVDYEPIYKRRVL